MAPDTSMESRYPGTTRRQSNLTRRMATPCGRMLSRKRWTRSLISGHSKPLPKDAKKPEGYTYVPVHLCFDVKFDLRRKARLVAGGNWTSAPDEDAFAGVVSLDAVRTAFFIADLNGLECMAADIGNAYLHGKTKEKIYTIAGPEFGELEGSILICVRVTVWPQNLHG